MWKAQREGRKSADKCKKGDGRKEEIEGDLIVIESQGVLRLQGTGVREEVRGKEGNGRVSFFFSGGS